MCSASQRHFRRHGITRVDRIQLEQPIRVKYLPFTTSSVHVTHPTERTSAASAATSDDVAATTTTKPRWQRSHGSQHDLSRSNGGRARGRCPSSSVHFHPRHPRRTAVAGGDGGVSSVHCAPSMLSRRPPPMPSTRPPPSRRRRRRHSESSLAPRPPSASEERPARARHRARRSHSTPFQSPHRARARPRAPHVAAARLCRYASSCSTCARLPSLSNECRRSRAAAGASSTWRRTSASRSCASTSSDEMRHDRRPPSRPHRRSTAS